MECKDVLNLLAIIVMPIVAVLIGQWLQNRSEKRKDKMYIFKTLMTSRIYLWTEESIHALNLIDVIYSKDETVRSAWAKLLEAYSSAEQSDLMAKKRQDLMYKLLEKMAKTLGYKEEITLETIQNPYVPKALTDRWKAQEKYQGDYANLISNMNKFFPAKEQSEKQI